MKKSTATCGKSLQDDSIDCLNESEAISSVDSSSFNRFRIHYLIVYIAIMLADGLQGECVTFYAHMQEA